MDVGAKRFWLQLAFQFLSRSVRKDWGQVQTSCCMRRPSSRLTFQYLSKAFSRVEVRYRCWMRRSGSQLAFQLHPPPPTFRDVWQGSGQVRILDEKVWLTTDVPISLKGIKEGWGQVQMLGEKIFLTTVIQIPLQSCSVGLRSSRDFGWKGLVYSLHFNSLKVFSKVGLRYVRHGSDALVYNCSCIPVVSQKCLIGLGSGMDVGWENIAYNWHSIPFQSCSVGLRSSTYLGWEGLVYNLHFNSS